MTGAGPPIGIVGGNFGSSVARAARRAGSAVVVWSRRARPELEAQGVEVVGALAELVRCELIVVAVPSPQLPAVADALGGVLDGRHLLVHVSRGLVGEQLDTGCQVLSRATPCRRVGVLAGPLTRQVLDQGLAGAAIIGSEFPEVGSAVRGALGSASLAIDETRDVRGVELSAAMVAVLLFALGAAQALGAGAASLGTLAARGVCELTRIGQLVGAQPETFTGLACLGDLVSAVAGDQRPELEFGAQVARGLAVDTALERVGVHVEAAAVAGRMVRWAAPRGLALPITAAIARVLEAPGTGPERVREILGQAIGLSGPAPMLVGAGR